MTAGQERIDLAAAVVAQTPVAWARYVRDNLDDFVFLDTETTGVRNGDVVVTIGLALGGAVEPVKIGMACKPAVSIPADATRIHGITNERVALSPPWLDVANIVERIVGERTIIAYNADFDWRLCVQSQPVGAPALLWLRSDRWQCAMLKYAAMIGDPHPRRANEFAWHKLQDVCDRYGISIRNHNAVADAVATREVVLRMAEEGS